jgi:hypothetical protein
MRQLVALCLCVSFLTAAPVSAEPAATKGRVIALGSLFVGLLSAFTSSVVLSGLRSDRFIDGVSCPPPQATTCRCCGLHNDTTVDLSNCTTPSVVEPIACPSGAVPECWVNDHFVSATVHYTTQTGQIIAASFLGASIGITMVSAAYFLLPTINCGLRRHMTLPVADLPLPVVQPGTAVPEDFM